MEQHSKLRTTLDLIEGYSFILGIAGYISLCTYGAARWLRHTPADFPVVLILWGASFGFLWQIVRWLMKANGLVPSFGAPERTAATIHRVRTQPNGVSSSDTLWPTLQRYAKYTDDCPNTTIKQTTSLGGTSTNSSTTEASDSILSSQSPQRIYSPALSDETMTRLMNSQPGQWVPLRSAPSSLHFSTTDTPPSSETSKPPPSETCSTQTALTLDCVYYLRYALTLLKQAERNIEKDFNYSAPATAYATLIRIAALAGRVETLTRGSNPET